MSTEITTTNATAVSYVNTINDITTAENRLIFAIEQSSSSTREISLILSRVKSTKLYEALTDEEGKPLKSVTAWAERFIRKPDGTADSSARILAMARAGDLIVENETLYGDLPYTMLTAIANVPQEVRDEWVKSGKLTPKTPQAEYRDLIKSYKTANDTTPKSANKTVKWYNYTLAYNNGKDKPILISSSMVTNDESDLWEVLSSLPFAISPDEFKGITNATTTGEDAAKSKYTWRTYTAFSPDSYPVVLSLISRLATKDERIEFARLIDKENTAAATLDALIAHATDVYTATTSKGIPHDVALICALVDVPTEYETQVTAALNSLPT